MSSNNQSKYGANRNLWRKYYPVGAPRREPQNVTLVDPYTAVTYSLNLQTTIRHRDFFEIIQATTGTSNVVPVLVLGEYDEGLIHFNNTDSTSFSFNFVFSNTPYVVFSMEQSAPTGANLENVNVFGLSKTVSGGMVGLSAPFSGTVRYRAAYSPTFPANFTSSFTASIVASAGTIPINYGVAYTASFAALTGPPVEFRNTPFNTSGSGQPDVWLDPDELTFANNSVNGSISAPYSGTIDFIAYQ